MSDTDRVAATRALQGVANEFLLFLQAHEYQLDCMMKPESVFSGQCLNRLRIQDWFGDEKHFPEIAQLVRRAEHGVPVCVASGGGPAFALRYLNHISADMYMDEITNKIRDDVRFGRAFVFPRESGARIPRLLVSPLAVIKSSTKLCVVHDLTFSSGPSMTGVNEDTDFSSAPACELGHVLRDIIWCILYLPQRFGRGGCLLYTSPSPRD